MSARGVKSALRIISRPSLGRFDRKTRRARGTDLAYLCLTKVSRRGELYCSHNSLYTHAHSGCIGSARWRSEHNVASLFARSSFISRRRPAARAFNALAQPATTRPCPESADISDLDIVSAKYLISGKGPRDTPSEETCAPPISRVALK